MAGSFAESVEECEDIPAEKPALLTAPFRHGEFLSRGGGWSDLKVVSCPHGVHVFPQVKQIECRKSFQRPTSSNRQPSISVSASFDGERRKVWPYQLLWRAAWDWSCNIFGKSNSASDFDFSWMQRKFSQNCDVIGMFCKLPLPVAAAAISKEIRGMWPGVKRHVKGFSFHVFRSDRMLSCCWKSNILQGYGFFFKEIYAFNF